LGKKTVLPFLFVLVLFASLAANNQLVKADSADFISFSSGVTIFSPLNRTYNSKFLTLNFTIACGWGIQYSLNYSVDGKYEGPMPYVIKNPEELHVVYYGTGLVELPELSEGAHSLTVYLGTSVNNSHIRPLYVDTVNFAIDLTPPNTSILSPMDLTSPNISILSPINKTYTVANITEAKIPLEFTVSENASQVAFSLDGQADILIAGNSTLSGLSVGSHNVTVYAQDLAGNAGASETVTFSIVAEPESSSSKPESFPTPLVIVASGASVAVIGVGLLAYFKKRQH
jgi:hypothetical protein